jgi:hypothetical protein
MYGAKKAADAAKAGQIDPAQVAAQQMQLQNQYGSQWTQNQTGNLRTGLLGNTDWGAFARTPEGQRILNESRDYYADNPDFATDESRLRNTAANGYINEDMLPRDNSGLGSVMGALQRQQDIGNADSSTFQRQRNLADMQALAPGADALGRQLNPEYYKALGSLSGAAGAPIEASPYETAFGQIAMQRSPTFALGGGSPSGGMGGKMGGRMMATRQANSASSAAIPGKGAPEAMTNGGMDMIYPSGPQPGGDPGEMQLGQVNERVAGPGGLTRQMTRGAMDSTTGPAALENTLYGQARDALAQGGDLTAQEQRMARATAAAGSQARGLGGTNSALAGEVLNLDSARRARLDSNRAFASGVDSQLRSGQAADRGYGLSLDADTLNRTQLGGQLQQMNITNRLNAAGFNAAQRQADLSALGGANNMYQQRNTDQFNRLATSAQMSTANLFNPYSVLGSTDNRVNSQQFLNQGLGTYQGLPDYATGAASNNASANAAAATNQANAYGALGGGLMSAGGDMLSAYIKTKKPSGD